MHIVRHNALERALEGIKALSRMGAAQPAWVDPEMLPYKREVLLTGAVAMDCCLPAGGVLVAVAGYRDNSCSEAFAARAG